MIKKMICAIVCFWGMSFIYANDWTRVLNDAKAIEEKLEFYGKVVDQDGHPVDGLVVLYKTTSAGFPKSKYKKGRVETDSNGLFTVKGGRISFFYFEGIEKQGYELQKRPPSFDYRRGYNRHKPDNEKPVVFHVRRKDYEGCYLLRSRMAVSLRMETDERQGDGRNYGKDFAQGITYKYSWRRRDEEEGAFWDIEATGEVDMERGVWNVVLKTNGGNSGIQRLDTLLYEAPSDGYAREVRLAIPFGMARVGESTEGKPSFRHFYARIREPGMFARLDVKEVSANEKELLIFCNVLINPYGGRSFEELTFLLQKLSESEQNNANAKLRKRINKSLNLKLDNCEKPALQAMREQHFAERPPFEEWIKEGLAFW